MADQMIDPNDLSALCAAIDRHPDARTFVVWQRADIEEAAEEHGVNPDQLDEALDDRSWRGWQESATVDGWETWVYPAAEALKKEA